MLKAVLLLVVAAAAMGTGVWVATRHADTAPTASTGAATAAPGPPGAALPRWQSFAFDDSNGQPYALKSLEGRMVVLNFWATWCPPCVEEMPELDGIVPKLKQNGIELIGIGIDSPSNIREFLQKRRFSYPLLVAGAGGSDLGRLLGNESGGLPFTVVINPAGQVIYKKMGRITGPEVLKATGLQQ